MNRSPSLEPTRDALAREGPSGRVLPRSGARSSAPARGAEGLVFAQVFAENAPYVWRALRRLGVREA
ncbi:MAG: hypothetical protein ABI134_03865, partial [Byssovorax sp.]